MNSSVEILYILQTGKADVPNGTIANIKESADGYPIRWSRRERPPRFGVIRISDASIDDLPEEMRKFGNCLSHELIDESIMHINEQNAVRDMSKYTNESPGFKLTITLQRLNELIKTNKVQWDASQIGASKFQLT
jgi:hypothetical protein